MTFSLRTLFGRASAAPAAPIFELTLTHKGEPLLYLNGETFALMRDNDLLSESFLQKVAAHMPNGGKQNWEVSDATQFSLLYEIITLDRITTVSPLGATSREPVITITPSQLKYLVGSEILSKDLVDTLKHTFASLVTKVDFNVLEIPSRQKNIAVTVYEDKFMHDKHLDKKRQQQRAFKR